MQNVGQARDVVILSLLAAQALLVSIRIPFCARRLEPLALIGLLVSLAWAIVLPGSRLALPAPILGIWSSGLFLLQGLGHPRRVGWTALNGAFLGAILLAASLGLTGSLSYQAFHLLGLGLLGGAVVTLLARLALRTRAPLLGAALAFAVGWFVSAAAPAVARALGQSLTDLSPWSIGGLALCTSWLVFQERYPLRPGWRGARGLAEDRDSLLASLYPRLQRTEDALLTQSRLVSAAHLAMAAAHEFRSTLSTVRLTAQHGLSLADGSGKDDSLRLLLDLAEAGEGSAVALLERLAREGREPERLMDAAEDLAGLIRRAGAPFRAERIMVRASMDVGVRFIARPGEVELLLLGLLRNSIDGYRRMGSTEKARIVEVRARCQEESAVLEVRDQAGGVPLEAEQHLFTIGFSGSASTGVGLYLSRSLAQANGGSLDYLPVQGGSVFRLAFPLAREQE